MPSFKSPSLEGTTFETDLLNKHLIYDYDVTTDSGEKEKWKYEIWFFSHDRVIYAIHGGPMAGRINYQTASYQCVRPGEIWQVNWLEETGTIVSLIWDIPNGKITTLLAFSSGHWDNPQAAHGNKRDPATFDRWRALAEIGKQTDRFMLAEAADISEVFEGKGELEAIGEGDETF